MMVVVITKLSFHFGTCRM